MKGFVSYRQVRTRSAIVVGPNTANRRLSSMVDLTAMRQCGFPFDAKASSFLADHFVNTASFLLPSVLGIRLL